jgi:hydroxybutyrate-dimer hydrolase
MQGTHSLSKSPTLIALLALASLTSLASCGGDSNSINVKPAQLGTVAVVSYDGTSDDLLTGGLGWDGLKGAAPAIANPNNPTAAELRKRAIYINYRALVDISPSGGYGSLYGPNVSVTGVIDTTPGAGKIAGKEFIAYSDDGSGKKNVTLMVQIPNSFDPANACVITATSSGSRGVYGAVSAAGEWGLKRGCAVAYNDKGTGNGGHELSSDKVTLIDGRLATATAAGRDSEFTALAANGTDLATFNTNFPNRYAFKHAHSQQNPEKDWGKTTLQAIEFALWAINDQYAQSANGQRMQTFKASNTLVIAASVSNGAGAALAAAEQDTTGLIDGVVVGEPQVNLRLPANGLSITRGGIAVPAFGKPLFDYTSIANLLQPCAAYAAVATGSPFQSSVTLASATNRCAQLAAAGTITGATFQAQADDAMAKLHAAGWESDSDLFHASHWAFATPAIAVTYANSYPRASVTENVCGFSFATTSATTGAPASAAASPMLTLFGNGNGIPATNGINIVYNDATGGAILHTLANGDFAYNGAACLRNLWTGSGGLAARLQTGVDEVKLTANLRGKPAIIVQGRSDTLVPINQTSRPYLGMNKIAEGASSKLSLIEVANAQHFDSFLAFAGYDTRLVPLHVYNLRALDAMWNTLRSGAALPPSQVVRTVPRGGLPGAAPAITSANVPVWSAAPAATEAIVVTNGTVAVPN